MHLRERAECADEWWKEIMQEQAVRSLRWEGPIGGVCSGRGEPEAAEKSKCHHCEWQNSAYRGG
jgi:hypothetical protein